MKFLVYLFLMMVTSVFAQTSNDSLRFPDDFFGVYKGDLEIYNSKGKQIIGMEFHLKNSDSIGRYQYTLVYIFNGQRQERYYQLIEKDTANGEFIIDENNGILLDAKVIDNVVYSMFEVQGSLLTTTERFYETYMDFEISVVNSSNKTESRFEGDEPIDVISYPILSVQRARLFKQ